MTRGQSPKKLNRHESSIYLLLLPYANFRIDQRKFMKMSG